MNDNTPETRDPLNDAAHDTVNDAVHGEQDAATTASAPNAEGNAADPAALQTRISDLEAALAAADEKALRAMAEAENRTRRAQKEVEQARKFALEGFVKSLVPILDAFDMAKKTLRDADTQTATSALEGTELLEQQFVEVLSQHGVTVIAPLNEPFDPNLHQAMTTQPRADVAENTVVEVYQRGLLLNDRLIRSAMVVVSAAA